MLCYSIHTHILWWEVKKNVPGEHIFIIHSRGLWCIRPKIQKSVAINSSGKLNSSLITWQFDVHELLVYRNYSLTRILFLHIFQFSCQKKYLRKNTIGLFRTKTITILRHLFFSIIGKFRSKITTLVKKILVENILYSTFHILKIKINKRSGRTKKIV